MRPSLLLLLLLSTLLCVACAPSDMSGEGVDAGGVCDPTPVHAAGYRAAPRCAPACLEPWSLLCGADAVPLCIYNNEIADYANGSGAHIDGLRPDHCACYDVNTQQPADGWRIDYAAGAAYNPGAPYSTVHGLEYSRNPANGEGVHVAIECDGALYAAAQSGPGAFYARFGRDRRPE